jgi:RNA recognition motif-containing protein
MGLAAFVFPATAGESSVEMDVRLYVGNLPKVTTEDELKTLFSQAGTDSRESSKSTAQSVQGLRLRNDAQ